MATHDASGHGAAQAPEHRRVDEREERGRYDFGVFARALVASVVVLGLARAASRAGWF